MTKYKIYFSADISQHFMNEVFGTYWWMETGKKKRFFTYASSDYEMKNIIVKMTEHGHVAMVEKIK